MIYLDNAATTWPKPECVLDAVKDAVTRLGGNPGRSGHLLSRLAAERIYEVREKVSELLGLKSPEKVVFTYNATYALNIALKAFITERCHVITSDVEHNSVIRPLFGLARDFGIEYSLFDSSLSPEESIPPLIRHDTRLIVSTLRSNVFGREIDLAALSRVASRYGIHLVVDASQAIGHRTLNLAKYPCDALCAPGHKGLFGIGGCGFAVFNSGKRLKALIEGGSGNESRSPGMPFLLPEGYEAGTLATASISSLGAGIDYINEIGIDEISKKLEMDGELIKEMLASVKGAVLYPSFGGLISFNFEGIPSNVIADELDGRGVFVRAGLHCSPSAHRVLGTLNGGTVRISLSALNRREEYDDLYSALKEISDIYF